MIRLGSLAGYAFSGPRLLGGWTPPAAPGVFAVLYKPDEGRDRYAVIYVGHADDLSVVGLPFRHRRSPCWVQRAGSKWRLHVATLDIPGGTAGHRTMITDELVSVYEPHCNAERYEVAWRDEWIGTWSDAVGTTPFPPPPARDEQPPA